MTVEITLSTPGDQRRDGRSIPSEIRAAQPIFAEIQGSSGGRCIDERVEVASSLAFPGAHPRRASGTIRATRGIHRTHPRQEAPIRTFTVSLIGVAALAAGLLLIRQQRQVDPSRLKEVPPGETLPTEISLDRLRESGY
jgi:hypothetical protein